MNTDIVRHLSNNEIKEAVFEFGLLKALGPYKFAGIFFQQFWDIVGEKVIKGVKSFFNGGFMLRELNKTNIVLVSKINHPNFISQYWLISLCNFGYNVIAKILVNHLKPWLDELIFPF